MITVLNQALDLLKTEPDPLKKICSSSAYWIPLVWLYDEMKKNRDIEIISELKEEVKKEYWKLVCQERPEKDRFVKVLMVQALHAYQKVLNQ